MVSHILRQFVIFSIAAGMLLNPLAAAAQYAYPTMSPSRTPAPTPMPTVSPSPSPTAAPVIDEAADFESTVDFDTTYVAFVEGKGDKSFETVPRLDPSKPEDKAKHDMYKDWVLKALSQAMQDTGLIKPYEAANVHIAIVDDLKAHLLANAEKYKLAAAFVVKLKEKDFTIQSFLVTSIGPDGKVTYILLIDESLVAEKTRNFAALIGVITRELQTLVLVEAGKKFPTDLDREIAIIEATIASLEKVLAGMEKMAGADHPAVKGLKTLIEAQKAKLAELKKKKEAVPPAPKPTSSPICTPVPMMSPSPSPS